MYRMQSRVRVLSNYIALRTLITTFLLRLISYQLRKDQIPAPCFLLRQLHEHGSSSRLEIKQLNQAGRPKLDQFQYFYTSVGDWYDSCNFHFMLILQGKTTDDRNTECQTEKIQNEMENCNIKRCERVRSVSVISQMDSQNLELKHILSFQVFSSMFKSHVKL